MSANCSFVSARPNTNSLRMGKGGIHKSVCCGSYPGKTAQKMGNGDKTPDFSRGFNFPVVLILGKLLQKWGLGGNPPDFSTGFHLPVAVILKIPPEMGIGDKPPDFSTGFNLPVALILGKLLQKWGVGGNPPDFSSGFNFPEDIRKFYIL